MAQNLVFQAASAKDSLIAEDRAQATVGSNVYAVLDEKKGIVSIAEGAALGSGVSTIDVSGSAFFKTVSVAAGNTNDLLIEGNGTVANVFYAGGGDATLFGGSGDWDESGKNPKFVTQADKLYGGDGANVFNYETNAGKDVIYNYGENDVVKITLAGATQTPSYVDKSGGLTITITENDLDKETLAGFAKGAIAKNSVLTIDGKSASAVGGKFDLKFYNDDGELIDEFTYGNTIKSAIEYAVNEKNKKVDATTLLVSDISELDSEIVNTGIISSGIKNIAVTDTINAVHVIGNGNANAITIGAAGGTIDGGTGVKATADKLYGTALAPVTFVFDAVNGGKDIIGDAKLTQYNYKAADQILLTNGNEVASIYAKGTDVMVSVDSNNILTIKNGLGKPINVIGEDEEPIIENWGETLTAGLNYDSDKMTKITADNAIITAGEPTSSRVEYVPAGTDEDGEILYKKKTYAVYDTIYLDGTATYADSVKEIDLSTSSAPVLVDTSEHSVTAAVKVGTEGSTVVGYSEYPVAQTFTAGNGNDLFVLDISKLTVDDNEAAATVALNKFKGDTFINFGASGSDLVSLVGFTSETNLMATESGKDLVIKVDDRSLFTIKNYSSDTGATILGDSGYQKEFGKDAMPAGLSFGDKKGKIDKTALVAGNLEDADTLHGKEGNFSQTELSTTDYGDSAIKTIDASKVTNSSKLKIEGNSAANNIYAPLDKISTTVDGGAGNDNITIGGGKTTYVFNAQDKGKKDVIYDYKDGDIILVDQTNQTLYAVATFDDAEKTGDFSYDKTGAKTVKGNMVLGVATTAGGFNDSKADVVITINKGNTITVKNADGRPINIQDGVGGEIYQFGHVIPNELKYDAKHTAVTLASGASYGGDVDLMETTTYYNTIKKVDLTGNTGVANIYGNTLANEFIAGDGGGILDGGSVEGLEDAKGNPIKPTADKLTGGNGADIFVYDAAYGKDSFLNFDEGDVVSLGAGIAKENLLIVDKKNVLTVSLVDLAWDTVKGAVLTAANSIFTITKKSDVVPVKFIGAGLNTDPDAEAGEDGTFIYGNTQTSVVSLDEKYATLTVDTDEDGVVVNAAEINTQPKVINARNSTGSVVLVGNANADAIYAGSGGSTLFGGTTGTKAVKDQLYGGAGKDYFVFSSQAGAKGKETDIVSNYAAGDVIVLDRAPDSIKADGKAITLTFNDEVEAGTKTSVVASTLVINGTAVDDTMKKFNPIDASVAVTFAIGSITNSETGAFDLTGATETHTYNLNPNATVEVEGQTKPVALSKGIPWDQLKDALGVEEESSQYAATDGWFEEIVSTDNASVSELDSILDAKGALNGDLAQLDGDAFFTNTSFESKAAAVTGARHQAKK